MSCRLALLALLVPVVAYAADPVKGQPAKPQPAEAARIHELTRKLSEPVSIDANEVPLKDLLTNLSATTGITFVLDSDSFRTEKKIMGDSAEEQVVKYPKLIDVSVSTVLHIALKPIDGTVLVRKDYVELTTRQKMTRECFTLDQLCQPGMFRAAALARDEEGTPLLDPNIGWRELPLVNGRFDRTALAVAMKNLGEQAGCNVLIKPGVIGPDAKKL